MKKRFFAMFLAAAMAFSLVSISAANVSTATESDPEIVNGYNINIIPSNVAEVLALMFVDSNVEAGLTDRWNGGHHRQQCCPHV